MRTLISLILLGSITGTVSASGPNADGPYRPDQADVITQEAPPAPRPTHDALRFTEAYAKAGRPALALLWNREFTDIVKQNISTRVDIDSAHLGIASRDPLGTTAAIIGGSTVSATTNVPVQQATRNAPSEHRDLEMRGAFVQTLVQAGVKLVDRNVSIRTTALERADNKIDSQSIETAALSKKAVLLLEVLNTPDAASPVGWATFISIKRFADGALLGEGYINSLPILAAAPPVPRFVANPGGGYREVHAPVIQYGMADVGRAAAISTMATLEQALSHLQ